MTKKLRFKSATYNPMSDISPQSPTAMEECYRLADALIPREQGEMQPHFPEKAKQWLWGLIAGSVY